MAKLNIEEVERLIREEEDPAALQAKLTAMIEEAHPANLFKDGEMMPLYEFERRFKRGLCDGNETRFAQWPLLVRVRDGRIYLDFGPCEDGDETPL